MDHNENSEVEKILSTPQKPPRTDTDFNMKEWICELRLHMKPHQSKNTVVDGVSMMESLQLAGIFNDMRIVKFPDYSSQLLLHVASKTFAAFDPEVTRYKDQEGTPQVSSSNSKPASILLLPSKTAVRQASRPSMGAPCSCSTNINNISGPQFRAQCECALGDRYHKMVTDALKLTKTFLTALESAGIRQRSAQVEIMSAALEKWMGLAHTALVVIDGVRDEGSGGWQDDSLLPGLCQHVTTLVITQVTALQMAWHSLRRKTTNTSDNARKGRDGRTQANATTTPRYVVTEKKLYTCEPPHVKVSERFAAYGLDAKFARYPILYVAWIWWSVVHSEENGDSAHGRFLAGLSESLGMCDWFTGSGRVEKDGANVEAWLSVVVTAGAACFMRRLGSGDYAGAVRGLAGSAYLETKTKIEESFKMEPEAMTHAMEMMLKYNGGGDPRPPFNTWMLASMYDSGSCGMTCEDSVHSWLRGAEVPSTYNMWNDILDYSRDLACGETRSFVSLLLDGLDQSQGAEPGDLVIAALFGAMEYIMKNEGLYGSGFASSMPMVYSWHLATCRYGIIKLYMVNLPTYVTDSEAHEPIRLQQHHLCRLSELYDGTNLTPKISYEETTPVKHLSYQSLLETCAVYLNVPSNHLAELLESNSTAHVPPQKEIYEDLIDRCERELRVAGVTHERCLNICCRHLERLIDLDLRSETEGRIAGETNVAVTLLALKSAHAYLKAQGLSSLWDLCKSTHFQWSIMCEVFGEAALAKEAVCAPCAELYGDAVDENACVLAAEMEESICDMGFEQRIKAIRAIFGGAFFGSSYLRIPLLDLYWRMNTAIIAQGHVGTGNAGDKFTI